MQVRPSIQLFAALAIAFVSLGCAAEGGPEGIKVGSRVPDFSVKTADNETVTRRSLEGQIVILNFWSTSCAPCVREMPELQEVQKSSQATVIGIALDAGGWRTVKPFINRHSVSYRIALGDEELFQRFDGIGVPYTLLLDRSQRIVRIYRGPVTREILDKDIRSIGGA
jgi:peroxiredoxin